MPTQYRAAWLTALLIILALLAACRRDDEPGAAPPPTPTPPTAPTATATLVTEINFITVATDAPNPPFADFAFIAIDDFGRLVGFDAEVMAQLTTLLGWEHEFVVTSYDGMLGSVAGGEFDVAVSALAREEVTAVEGIAYSEPYLEVGQVLVVRANDTTLTSYRAITPGTPIGALAFSAGEVAAREVAGVTESDLVRFEQAPAMMQALIDGAIAGAILDHNSARRYTEEYWQQLKIAGGPERDAWLDARSYVMAVAADNTFLLGALNDALARTAEERRAAVDEWLVAFEPIDAGESLVGTLPDQLVVGVVNQEINLDTTAPADLINWELLVNIAGGLMMRDGKNVLVPALAEGPPLVGEGGTAYTFTLREGLTFPDGRPLRADDVKWSIGRAAARGVTVVNAVLKDVDDNGFADEDAVEVLNERQFKFALQAPAPFFLDLLATPPYFVLSQSCYAEVADPVRNCPGLGPYTLAEWRPDEALELAANPQWPGPAPGLPRVQVRLYESTAAMRSSLTNNSLDIAWTGLTEQDLIALRAEPAFTFWQGPAAFKSYLVFEHSEPPWDDPRIRRAAAYAVDREALAAVFNGLRQPLYSPVPDSAPAHVASEPGRDLDQARALLAQAGYSAANPLVVTIWYINDGRYGPHEATYAEALKAQLEETGVFQVTLESSPWLTYRAQMSQCEYPAFLLGWPVPGQPPRAADPSSWISYFVNNTSTLCSNYESATMATLLAALDAANPLAQETVNGLYADVQQLWAEEYPTLDLTQVPRLAVSLPNVGGVDAAIDAMGLLRYDRVIKGG